MIVAVAMVFGVTVGVEVSARATVLVAVLAEDMVATIVVGVV